MHDVLAALADRAEHARAAAARQRAELRPARPRGGSGSGAGGGISLDDVLLGAAAVVAGEMIRALWRKTARPLAGRVASQLERRSQEAMAAALSAAGRRPELLCCGRDQIVFVAGGRRTVPAGDAMRLLLRGDDTSLVAALREGA